MITTGIITEINISNEDSTLTNNLFKVKVPYFDNPGIDTECIITCTASTPSNLYNPYAVGDMVYITFIDNNYSQGLILGSIYKGVTNISRGYLVTESLKVTGTAELPSSTKLGPMTVQDIIDHEEVIDNLQSSVDQLEPKVADLEDKIDSTYFKYDSAGITGQISTGPVGVRFSINNDDYAGLYMLTFGNAFMLLPCGSLTVDTIYKTSGTFIATEGATQVGAVSTTVNFRHVVITNNHYIEV